MLPCWSLLFLVYLTRIVIVIVIVILLLWDTEIGHLFKDGVTNAAIVEIFNNMLKWMDEWMNELLRAIRDLCQRRFFIFFFHHLY